MRSSRVISVRFFDKRLGHEHAIERIAMMQRQLAERVSMIGENRQLFDRLLIENIGKILRQVKLVQ